MSSKSVTSDKSPSNDAKIYTLRESRQTCVVRELKDDMITAAFHLISDAVERGDNVGVDEVPDLEFLQFVLDFGTAWCFTDLNTGQLNCLLIISPCRFARSQHPILGQAIIVTSRSFSDRTHLRDLADIACGFVEGQGFSACVIEVFMTCVQHLMAFRDAGFLVTCIVPDAGKLVSRKGLCSSYVMHKELRSGNTPMSTPDSRVDENLLGFKPTMRQLNSPYLPLRYHMKNGSDVIVRPMLQQEVKTFYDCAKAESMASNGYGFDEFPNFEYFCRWYIHDFYNFTVEDCSTGKIIAYQNFGHSLFSRMQKGCGMVDANTIILPEFRGKKFCEELFYIQDCISVECGFKSLISETAATNVATIILSLRCGAAITGTIPRAIYFQHSGWVDLAMFFRRYSGDIVSLKDLSLRSKL